MAEAALSGFAGKLLGELGSLTFKKAFERFQSIRKAKEDLDELIRTIRIIQAVLLDAEKKQEDSEAVRQWIQDVKDVLYDADDLFDDVATDALLEQLQQDKKNKLLAKVRAPLSMFSAISSDDNIAKRVKAIRKRLDKIHSDMAPFNFVRSTCENAGPRKRAETRPFVDEKVVIGRDDDKKAILEFLFAMSEDAEQSTVSVIAIVGIGGMGKTTLAQLIYNNEGVQKNFEKRCWACISDIVGETNVLDRIARSMDKDFRPDSDPKELIDRSVVSGGKYLLVLDDVWDNDLGIWFDIISLLSGGAKGSKIIVTTRSGSVPRALQKDKCSVHTLKDLSKNESWELFKKIAFTEEQENDSRWTSLGRKIMQKCAKVPLAIKSVAGVLRGKSRIHQWESFKKRELSKIDPSDASIMPTLKLSYDHLSSHLKQCFAYCSMFPQDYVFHREQLICQWIAQGYVKPEDNDTFENAGHGYFMELFSKSFFQEAKIDEDGDIRSCKMHDLIHDLAKNIAGEESSTLTTKWRQFHKNTRHLLVHYRANISKKMPQSLLDDNRLRTCFHEPSNFKSPSGFVLPWTKFKLLRLLHLRNRAIENVPSSIGDLKHLRYLTISESKITSLPESLTGLVNLITLDISLCFHLEALPNSIGKLINLRHLYTDGCSNMRDMPAGLWELTGLQHLSCLKVSEKTGCRSKLDLLAGLRLKGRLVIEFDEEIDDWEEDECWQLPSTLQGLHISNYPGKRIPYMDPINLMHLCLGGSSTSTIKHLPPLRCLLYLKHLQLDHFNEVEYVEEEEDSENEEGMKSALSTGPSSTLFYPRLEKITLSGLGKLKGWSREEEPDSLFPRLSRLSISNCPALKSMPLCPGLQSLVLSDGIDEELMQQLLSAGSHSSTSIVPSTLQTIQVYNVLTESFSAETLTSLRILVFYDCYALKKLCLAPRQLNVLENLKIGECEGLEFKLWEEDVHKRGVDWDSLPCLRYLEITEMGELPETLPHSLQQLQSQGQLEIKCYPRTYRYSHADW